jgi:hypothetical protein
VQRLVALYVVPAVLQTPLHHRSTSHHATGQTGVARYVAYTRLVVGARARELYAALCEALDGAGAAPPGGGKKGGGGGVDFASALTALFRELAVAAERDEKVGRRARGL